MVYSPSEKLCKLKEWLETFVRVDDRISMLVESCHIARIYGNLAVSYSIVKSKIGAVLAYSLFLYYIQ